MSVTEFTPNPTLLQCFSVRHLVLQFAAAVFDAWLNFLVTAVRVVGNFCSYHMHLSA